MGPQAEAGEVFLELSPEEAAQVSITKQGNIDMYNKVGSILRFSDSRFFV